jgi:hypothetical protein
MVVREITLHQEGLLAIAHEKFKHKPNFKKLKRMRFL